MKSLSWIVEIQERVNAGLRAFLGEKRRVVSQISPLSTELVDEIADLTMRGGKRLRPIALFVGFRAASPGGDPKNTLDASMALELLQTYLLIHDDWMDQDDQRRGGATVHSKLGKIHEDKHLGDCLGVIAGDLACGYAWELINQAPFPNDRRQEAHSEFASMHQDIVLGQHLDLIGYQEVERMYDLKSGSYTVRGPLRLGAILGNANQEQLKVFDEFSRPIGIAFQLRDDLLSAFGGGKKLGKPVGNDLRAGKHTLIVAEAMALMTEEETRVFRQTFGNQVASDQDVADAVAILVSCGAKEKVEDRLNTLVQKARESLSRAAVSTEGLALMEQLVDLLTKRDY
jgi:geranylgeranyl diphosphate synthase, type I